MSQFNSLSNGALALVDFYADWCGPCQTMKPVLEQIDREYGQKVKLVKVNVDTSRPIADKFNIRSIPTLMIINNKSVVWRKTGIVRKADIKSALNKSLK